MADEITVTLPVYAQNRIRSMQAQLQSMQAQIQQFADGCLVGMGLNMDEDISVNLETMVITIKPKEQV